MKELFVPLELALKLKEKGFDEPCIGYFAYDYLNNKPNKLSITDNPVKSSKIKKKYEAAPLYQQVIDWFWDKHQISVFPYRDHRGTWYGITFDHSYKSITVPPYESHNRVHDSDTYQSKDYFEDWYDCQNKAIEEALKLI